MNKHFTQIPAIALTVAAIIIILFTSSRSVQAADQGGDLVVEPLNYYYIGQSPYLDEPETYDPLCMTIVDGKKTFCIQSHVPTYTSGGYVSEVYTAPNKDLLSKIVYYGYTNTNQTDYDYAVTQFMIWGELGDEYIDSDVPNYLERKAEIMEMVNKHSTIPSFSNQSFSLEAGKSFTINDTNNVLANMTLTSNTANTPIELSGNSLKLTPSSASNDGSITFQKIPSQDIGPSILYTKLDFQSLVEFHLEDNVYSKVNVNIVHLGDLQVKKVDELTNLPLPDSTLKFEYSGISKEITTDTNGLARLSDIPEGTIVKVTEVKAPDGYFNKNDIETFTIEPDKTLEIELSSQPQQGLFNLQQLGEKAVTITTEDTKYGLQYDFLFDYMPLAGICYEVRAMEDIVSGGKTYYNKDDLVAQVCTGEDGSLINMPKLFLGKYQAIEISAPDGYIINTKPINFAFTYQNQFIEYVAFDTTVNSYFQKLKLSLLKQEEFIKSWKDNLPIIDNIGASNKVFALYTNQDITLSDTITIPKDALLTYGTVNDGILLLENLQYPEASYYFKEVDSGTEHKLNENKYIFDFTATNNDNAMQEFIISELNETNEISPILNALHFNNFSFKKVNEKSSISRDNGYIFTFNEIAKGAIFTLEDANEEIIQTVSTNSDSIANFNNIPVGTFYLKEKNVSSIEYLLSSEIIKIESSKEGIKFYNKLNQLIGEQDADVSNDIISFEFQNSLIKGSMTLKIVDQDTGVPLPDATIALFDKDRNLIKSPDSNMDGLVHFDSLPKDVYYYQEITAPTGYQLDSKQYAFEIVDQDQDLQVVMGNKKISTEHPQTGDSNETKQLLFGTFLLTIFASFFYIKKHK